jgi:subtilisin family serine protease
MARRPRKTGQAQGRKEADQHIDERLPEDTGGGDVTVPMTDPIIDTTSPATTGRYIVIFKEDVSASTIKSTLNNVAGLRNVMASADFAERGISSEEVAESKAVHFSKLGIAIVTEEEAFHNLAVSSSDADSPILTVEPEYISYLSNSGGLSLDYLRGFRDAANRLYEEATGAGVSPEEVAGILATFQDTPQFTWGLQATRASTSRHSGQGVRVAVLDTGLDLQHPDFRGRAITARSFVAGIPTAQDIHGHGTHCVGTACGPQRPATGVRRYGVAFGAQIFVGKVFNNQPNPGAATGDVIAGIEWAATNGCRVVSLSLGARIDQKIRQYEIPIQRALNAGVLVVAAAGNNANRPGVLGFVEPPANADAAMAVAAIDNQLRIASFSARSSQITGVGGIVNIAGPGVSVFSSVPVARGGHATFNGTSMATPHVAGIAALWSGVTGLTGQALWNKVVQSVRPLSIPSLDVGSGLAQAPQ